jgi:hypothetical protein
MKIAVIKRLLLHCNIVRWIVLINVIYKGGTKITVSSLFEEEFFKIDDSM